MNIGDVSRETGLPAKTIRYYEDIGLVTPERKPNGYRLFDPSDVHKLTFLGRARSLGFSIEQCRALLALYEDRDRASSDVRAIAKEHLSEIEQKIAELREMHETLSHLVSCCAGNDRPDCPILADLGKGTPRN